MEVMENNSATAQIIDFTAFREQKVLTESTAAASSAPMLMWYPVWVLVPTPAPAP